MQSAIESARFTPVHPAGQTSEDGWSTVAVIDNPRVLDMVGAIQSPIEWTTCIQTRIRPADPADPADSLRVEIKLVIPSPPIPLAPAWPPMPERFRTASLTGYSIPHVIHGYSRIDILATAAAIAEREVLGPIQEKGEV